YGPHIGILWGKKDLIEALDAPRLDPAPQESPERLEPGTQNHEGMVGAAAAVDFLASLVGGTGQDGPRRHRLRQTFAMLHHKARELFTRLWDGLGDVAGVTRHGLPPTGTRTPTLGFNVAGYTAD